MIPDVKVPPTLAPALRGEAPVATKVPSHSKFGVATGRAKRVPRASGKNDTATASALVTMLRVSVDLIFDAVMVPPA